MILQNGLKQTQQLHRQLYRQISNWKYVCVTPVSVDICDYGVHKTAIKKFLVAFLISEHPLSYWIFI